MVVWIIQRCQLDYFRQMGGVVVKVARNQHVSFGWDVVGVTDTALVRKQQLRRLK